MAVKIGIIGGTGLDDPDILQGKEEKQTISLYPRVWVSNIPRLVNSAVECARDYTTSHNSVITEVKKEGEVFDTTEPNSSDWLTIKTDLKKFSGTEPSDVLVTGKIEGVSCVLLARHGKKHHLMPSHINYRANIHALKAEGCTHIIVTTACGSLREDIHPGDIVFLDQFIDRTCKRESTFYDGKHMSPPGICHMQMDQPFCEHTRSVLIRAAKKLQLRYHERGTAVTIEGPRFSSKAESNMFRSWNCDVVNMTTVPEVCLAKEAGICYASIALPTDYDCWKDEPVNVPMVVKTMKENGEKAAKLILAVVPMIAQEEWHVTFGALQTLVKTSVMIP